jgi:hypothetical protein
MKIGFFLNKLNNKEENNNRNEQPTTFQELCSLAKSCIKAKRFDAALVWLYDAAKLAVGERNKKKIQQMLDEISVVEFSMANIAYIFAKNQQSDVFLGLLKKNKTITHLTYGRCSPNSAINALFIDFLIASPSLKSLDFSKFYNWNNRNDNTIALQTEHIKLLRSALVVNQVIEKINFSNQEKLTNADAKILFDAIEKNPNSKLNCINLTGTLIDDTLQYFFMTINKENIMKIGAYFANQSDENINYFRL